jgi:hypothetical protein
MGSWCNHQPDEVELRGSRVVLVDEKDETVDADRVAAIVADGRNPVTDGANVRADTTVLNGGGTADCTKDAGCSQVIWPKLRSDPRSQDGAAPSSSSNTFRVRTSETAGERKVKDVRPPDCFDDVELSTYRCFDVSMAGAPVGDRKMTRSDICIIRSRF